MSLIQGLSDLARNARSLFSNPLMNPLLNPRIPYLQSEIPKWQEALNATPVGHPNRVQNLSKLGGLLGERYSYSNDIVDSEAAVVMLKEAADIYPTGHDEKATLLNLATLLLINRTYGPEDSGALGYQRAMDMTREALNETPVHHPERDMAYKKFVILRVIRYVNTRDMVDTEEVIRASKYVIDIMPRSNPLWSGCAVLLASFLKERYPLTVNDKDLDRSIVMFQDTLDTIPEDQSVKMNYDTSWIPDTGLRGDTAPLLQEAIKSTQGTDESIRIAFLSYLGVRLGERHSRTGSKTDLEKAISMLQAVVDATSASHPDRPMRLGNLGVQLGNRWFLTRDKVDLEDAIRMTREGIEALPPNKLVEKATLLNNLGIRMGDMFSISPKPEYIDEAIHRLQEAVKLIPLDYFDRSKWLVNLAQRLHDRHYSTGDQTDLDDAIRIVQQARQLVPPDHPSQAKIASHLGVYLGDQYSRTGDMEYLEKAIHETRKAIDTTPKDHPERSAWLNNLGLRVNDRYARTGAIGDLEEAIRKTQEAIDLTPKDHPDRASRLSNLGFWLSDRYARIGAMEDLERAIRLTQEAIDLTPKDHPDRAAYLNNIGLKLAFKYHRTEVVADLDNSIARIEEAVHATPKTHPNQAKWLSNLGSRLVERYNHDMKESEKKNKLEREKEQKYLSEHWRKNMERIIKTYGDLREVIDATPSDHPNRAAYLNNAGLLLLPIYFSRGDREDLHEAISLSSKSIDMTPEDHPNRAQRLINLAHYLSLEYKTTRNATDLEQSRDLLVEALYSSTSSISTRIAAGQSFLSTDDVLNDSRAYRIAEMTVGLIPLLTPRSLQNTDKRYILSTAVGISSDAAALALHFNKGPLAAVNCLETGRAVMAGGILQQHDLSLLEQNNKQLATKFVDVRSQLDTLDLVDSDFSADNMATTPMTTADRRRDANQNLESILQEIRSIAGFERFLLPASEADMLNAAKHGPIVILNTSKYRSDALIVEQTGIRLLELSHITPKKINKFLFNDTKEKKPHDDPDCLEKLEHLWDGIVHHVLKEIGLTEVPPGRQLPHMWWIPTGKLTKAPLHAAGKHLQRKMNTALDMVVSSYASSIKVIIHSRKQRRRKPVDTDLSRLVTVAMDYTEGQKHLQHVKSEVNEVHKVLKIKASSETRPRRFPKDVLSAIKTCQIFHFAGHGLTDPKEPLQSSLLLEGGKAGRLTVQNLLEADLNTNSPFLAYLSACGTSRIKSEGSVDESVHLANAFQLAGFCHVIGTQWSVDDEMCVSVAGRTYQFLKDNGVSDESVSRGLHHAMKTLRDEWIRNQFGGNGPIRDLSEARNAVLDEDLSPSWIPYIHYGM